MSTKLDPHVRGGTFIYNFTLGNSWVGSNFTGGVKFTIRSKAPGPASGADVGPDIVAQASTTDGSISFVSEDGSIVIDAAKTRKWPVGVFYWDLHGVVDAATDLVYKIDYGTIEVLADYTRS